MMSGSCFLTHFLQGYKARAHLIQCNCCQFECLSYNFLMSLRNYSLNPRADIQGSYADPVALRERPLPLLHFWVLTQQSYRNSCDSKIVCVCASLRRKKPTSFEIIYVGSLEIAPLGKNLTACLTHTHISQTLRDSLSSQLGFGRRAT